MAKLQADVRVVRSCTKSTIRRQPASCSGAYIPVQPGVIRPAARDADHLRHHQRRAAERFATGLDEVEVVGMPSTAEYMSIAETITRFFNSSLAQAKRLEHRRCCRIRLRSRLWCTQLSANHASTPATNSGSRRRRLS